MKFSVRDATDWGEHRVLCCNAAAATNNDQRHGAERRANHQNTTGTKRQSQRQGIHKLTSSIIFRSFCQNNTFTESWYSITPTLTQFEIFQTMEECLNWADKNIGGEMEIENNGSEDFVKTIFGAKNGLLIR